MIKIADNAGFCFGVKRACEMIERAADSTEKVYCLGEPIHNRNYNAMLERKGVTILPDDASILPSDGTLFIRTHGVPKSISEKIRSSCPNFVDATCPFVLRIYKIVKAESAKGRFAVILGDSNHPEVKGIVSYASAGCRVFSKAAEAAEFVKNTFSDQNLFFAAVQTTFSKEEWKLFENILKTLYTNPNLFDTICNVTSVRQEETDRLTKSCDAAIVVGGLKSSNTKKLYDIAVKNCPNTIMTENASALAPDFDKLKNSHNMIIIAGASTPSDVIQEVYKTMAELLNEELSFAEMLDQSFKTLNTGERVVGVISAVSPAEIKVDLGTKHTGILPYDEIVTEGNIDLEKEYHVGDTIDVMCLKFSDVEGTVMLSKKRLDEDKFLAAVSEAAESGEILHGTVKEVVKGGVIVTVNGVRIFVPASQCGPEGMDLETLKNQKVPVKVFEYNAQRKRARGSIRSAKRTERKQKLNEFYATLSEGQKITGTIRSITSYGVFVNLGDADGMVHISDLFWGRPRNPADAFKVGDSIDVYVKSVDREKERISLGYKTEENNPWNIFNNNYKLGDTVNVTVVSIMPFGAFAEIIPGVDGLIHCSQIAEKFVQNPASVLKIGDKVDAKIIGIEDERNRISLSIKAVIAPEAYEADVRAAEEKAAKKAAAEAEADAE